MHYYYQLHSKDYSKASARNIQKRKRDGGGGGERETPTYSVRGRKRERLGRDGRKGAREREEELTAGKEARGRKRASERETDGPSKVKQRSERNTRESRRGLAKEPKVSRSLGVAADR